MPRLEAGRLRASADCGPALVVFFRVFAEEPESPVDRINAVRGEELPIAEVSLFNPHLTPERLGGTPLILALKAIDEQCQRYDIEMQVRRFAAWSTRGML